MAAACDGDPEYARQFEPLPQPLREARRAMLEGRLMQSILHGARRSVVAATDQQFNACVLEDLLRRCARVAPRALAGGGTVALEWDAVTFEPPDFSPEQTLGDSGTYGGTLSARATIIRTPPGGGQPFARHLGSMEVAFVHLMVGSDLDPRSGGRFESAHLPPGAFVVNGHPRTVATSVGLPQLLAPLVFAPPASKKTASAMMRFCNGRERCSLLIQGDTPKRVAVLAQGRRSAPVGVVLAALLHDDADAAEEVVRGAAVGDPRLWEFLYETVLVPMQPEWRPADGRRRVRDRWAADSASWDPDDIRSDLLPGLGSARAATVELLLRRLAVAEVYSVYAARDHPANLYVCCPGRALRALAEERFQELGAAVAHWLESDRAGDDDAARTHLAAMVKRIVIKKWHNRNWTGTWGMHRSLTQDLELLSPIMSAALVDVVHRRGGEKSLDPRGARGAEQARAPSGFSAMFIEPPRQRPGGCKGGGSTPAWRLKSAFGSHVGGTPFPPAPPLPLRGAFLRRRLRRNVH
jgi:hypothetical protein